MDALSAAGSFATAVQAVVCGSSHACRCTSMRDAYNSLHLCICTLPRCQVLVSDDDDDDDDDVMSLDAEDDASDDDDFVDLEDEDDDAAARPKPAKRAKPSTPAATKSAGSTPGRKGAAAAAAPKGKAAGGRGKATKHEMVIEKGSQEGSEKKRKVPGSMVRSFHLLSFPTAPKWGNRPTHEGGKQGWWGTSIAMQSQYCIDGRV